MTSHRTDGLIFNKNIDRPIANPISSPTDNTLFTINGVPSIKAAGTIHHVNHTEKENLLPLVYSDINIDATTSPSSSSSRIETPPAPGKPPTPEANKSRHPISLRSPPRGPNRITTQIPISTPVPQMTSPVFNILSPKKGPSPHKIENASIPQVPLLKVQPIASIRGSSPPRTSTKVQQPPVQPIPVPQYSNPQRAWFEPNISAIPQRPPRPNYSMMSDEEQKSMLVTFKTKYSILQTSFPTWNIKFPLDGSSLDYIHDEYESYVKKIIISLNSNQWKVYLVLMFFAIEVFIIKVMGIDIKGYAISQIRIINRYDQLLAELGEKYYLQGPSNWPTEMKILIMAGFNAIIFIAVKYMAQYIGGDAVAAPIHAAINHFLGDGMNSSAGLDEIGVPIISQTEAPVGDIGSTINGFMNGGFDINGMLNGLQSVLNTNRNSPGNGAPPVRRPNFTE